MKIGKKIVFAVLASIVVFIIAGLLLYPFAGRQIASRYIASAVGGCPYQVGITSVVDIMCMTAGTPPVCVGGALCSLLDPARCALYDDISGMQAGGMGRNILLQKTAMAQAGLMAGGQLIACGMGPTLMDSGVLASAGGCYGCMAKADWKDKILGTYDFIIAGFKGD